MHYPHARVAIDGGGDLLAVTNLKYDLTNNGKLVHTIGGSGRSKGFIEVTGSFDCPVPETGVVNPWTKWVKEDSEHELRFKIPGETLGVLVSFTKVSTDGPGDDAVKQTIEFHGAPLK